MRKQLKQVVPETERRKSLGRILEQLHDSAQGFNESHQRQIEKLLGSLRQHETTREQLERQLTELDALNEFSQRTMLDLRFRLREGVSAEEWARLFPPPPSATP